MTNNNPIDPHSEYSLYDLINNDVPAGKSTEYEGFHLISTGSRFMAQYDGHVGRIKTFDPDDYDDVLELVADLNRLVRRLNEYDYQDDRDGLVEWAGEIATSDEERAEESDHHVYVSDDIGTDPSAGDD